MDWKSFVFIGLLVVSFFLIQEWFSPKPSDNLAKAQPIKEQVVTPPTPTVDKRKNEKFYVLENDYMQVVFSNIGGSVAEINLPFKDKKDQKSVVNKVELDRILEKEKDICNLFPQNPYFVFAEKGMELREGKSGGYYPLLRRSTPAHLLDPKYYAMNIDGEFSELEYKLKRFEKDVIEFEVALPERKITKIFKLTESPYCIDVNINIDGSYKNMWLNSGVVDVELILDSFSPEIKYRTVRGEKSSLENVDLPKTSIESASTYYKWICTSNGFLGLIMAPQEGIGFKAALVEGSLAPSRLTLVDAKYDLYPAQKYPGYELKLPLSASSKFNVFAGPFDEKILHKVDEVYKDDYVSVKAIQGFLSTISEPFAKFLLILMKFFYKICGSWGVSILLLTVALRLILYPLNSWSIKSQQRMQEVAPKIKAIQERYKKDPKKAQMEMVKVYKESGGNPLAGGCLPVLIQIPILFGMFLMLKSSFELRGVVFIPGWIDNLTAPDVVWSWDYPLFIIGNHLHLLPILLGGVTFLQQRMSLKMPKNASQMSDQQRQQVVMGNIMSVVLIFIFYKLPSGLNIYYLFSTLLGILQQWLLNRKKPLEIVQK